VVVSYASPVPRIWTETIEGHRREVRAAILSATWGLVEQHGVLSVTMSQIAHEAGIGRATLYKYFPDVEAILSAWHEDQVARHLEQLAAVRVRPGDAGGRLEAVLHAYALNVHQRPQHGTELGAVLHRSHGGEHGLHARHQLHDMIRGLIAQAAESGDVRDDVAPDELAAYCLHAVAAAGGLPSVAAVRRLVSVVLAGVRSGRVAAR
jgi:AcrR family transcriptional regulator